MNAVTYLHDHRPVTPAHRMARKIATARGIIHEPEQHRPEMVIDACRFFLDEAQPFERQTVEARLKEAEAAERRHAWCMNQPSAVTRRRRAILTEAVLGSVAVALSASFALSMIVYVLAMV